VRPERKTVEAGIGLVLDGHGFRAALFHAGAIMRLNELRCLPRLSRVSSVSGGSIVAGLLAARWDELRFTDGAAENLDERVTGPLLTFCQRPIAAPPHSRTGQGLARHYAHLVGEMPLRALPPRPAFVFNATAPDTRVDFRFSKTYAGDHCVGMIPEPGFPLAVAMAASTAGPPHFPPVWIEVYPGAFEQNGRPRVDTPARLGLTSGGLEDELILEPFWKRIETVLLSDAGATEGPGLPPRLGQLLEGRVRHGTYWGMASEIAGYKVRDTLPVPVPVSRALAGVHCQLGPLTEAEACAVLNWGYAVANAAMFALGVPGARPAPRWPYPAYALDGRVATAPPAPEASQPGWASGTTRAEVFSGAPGPRPPTMAS
jgi:NTE family protein